MQKSSCQKLRHDSPGSTTTPDVGHLVDLSTPVVLICPVQVTEALKIVPGNQKVEVVISIPGSN